MKTAAFSYELNQQKVGMAGRVFDAYTIIQSHNQRMNYDDGEYEIGAFRQCSILPAVVYFALLFQGGSLFRSANSCEINLNFDVLLFSSSDSVIICVALCTTSK